MTVSNISTALFWQVVLQPAQVIVQLALNILGASIRGPCGSCGGS
eukprot:COSAG03_NODE_19348_length_338_cov_1.184100_2_plen_44_part_01